MSGVGWGQGPRGPSANGRLEIGVSTAFSSSGVGGEGKRKRAEPKGQAESFPMLRFDAFFPQLDFKYFKGMVYIFCLFVFSKVG